MCSPPPPRATPRTAATSSRAAEQICGAPIELLSGSARRELSALGVISGFTSRTASSATSAAAARADRRATATSRRRHHPAARRPALQDASERLAEEGRRRSCARRSAGAEPLRRPQGPLLLRRRRHLALARPAAHDADAAIRCTSCTTTRSPAERGAATSAAWSQRVDTETLSQGSTASRGPPPAARLWRLVLEEIIRAGKPTRRRRSRRWACARACSIQLLTPGARSRDPLIVGGATSSTSCARARPRHGEELLRLDRPASWRRRPRRDRRREARCAMPPACSPTSAGGRIPDYRGEQSLNIIAHAAFVGIDHPGRAYLALANSSAMRGSERREVSPRLRELADDAHAGPRPRARRR